jgi:NAD(P)-dependent dehydrogenase (short-subunit alcohol dehydrogenase family)
VEYLGQNMSLDDRVAIVTGGGRGIGRGIAVRLAHDGADVVLTYTRDEVAAGEAVAEIEALGRRALAVKGTVQSACDNKRLVDTAMDRFGRIDILVHNAGIASRGRTVAETDSSEVERLLAVHAIGPHTLSGLAEALAITLAKEVRRYGIRVNIVRPGLVDTDMGRRLAVATRGVKDIHELNAQMPFGRVCAPGDIANAVAFFVSHTADYVSGQTLSVSGGQEW